MVKQHSSFVFPSGRNIIILLGIVLGLSVVRAAYTVAGDDHNTCLYASFDVNLYVYRNISDNKTSEYSTENHSFRLPKASEDNVTVTGGCDEDGLYTLKVDWLDKTNFTLIMEFVKYSSNWTLDKITFDFTLEYFGEIGDGYDVIKMYFTEEQKFFNRTFKTDEYFYCDDCKLYYFSNSSGACVGSKCSYLTIEKSTIYLGDFESDNPKKKLCIEDWIAEREIIVPIAVGGFLILLVMILILAYIGTFIKRKLKERTVNYRRMNK